MKYSTIYVNLISPKGKTVKGKIIVRNNFCLSTFSDQNLAKQLYEYDLDNGEDVAFNEKLNAYIKRYKGMKRKEILEELKKEIIKAGGQLIEKCEN